MCVNSFTSLSIEPPMVLFSAALSSTTWPSIREVGVLTINILRDSQGVTARAFSTRGADRFSGVDYLLSPTGGPVLNESLAFIDCELDRVIPAGDHEIAICHVTSLAAHDSGRPLVFYGSSFGTFDPVAPGANRV
jgi:flavin reductase (DIM6/NTAB) family NADH-FMN oxidoreductase RutF